jgi:hypothetical protein
MTNEGSSKGIAASGLLPPPPKVGTWARAGVIKKYTAVSKIKKIPEH